jgi:hypothetical protein
MSFSKRLLALLLVALLLPFPAWGWGYEGHTFVNQVAARKMPREMPDFFRKGRKLITHLGYEPDRWRDSRDVSLRNAQAPDHFIDFEQVADVSEFPRERYDFYRLLYEKRAATPGSPDDLLPEGVGVQPYITMEVYERLRSAFREYRALKQEKKRTKEVEKKIVFYAGWLGHYVADGSQPLHTTIHHHGWVGENPNQYTTDGKIHSQFESVYVAANLKAEYFKDQVQAPVRLSDPFADYMKYLRESNQLVEEFYRLEKTGAFAGWGTAEGREFTLLRLAAASQMLLNLWYTAWLESAEPAPPRPPAPPSTAPPPKVPLAPQPATPPPPLSK